MDNAIESVSPVSGNMPRDIPTAPPPKVDVARFEGAMRSGEIGSPGVANIPEADLVSHGTSADRPVSGNEAGRYELLDKVISFDEKAGFADNETHEKYQNIFRTLYDESTTFNNVIGNLSDSDKTLSFTREVGVASHGDTDDGQNFRVNVDDSRQSTHVAYDPLTQEAYAKDKFSLPRYLVHETIHALGLRDDVPLDDYKENLKGLESGKNLLDTLTGSLEGSPAEREQEALAGIAPGPVVRMTNQILNESDTYHEDPRVMYNTLTEENDATVQSFVQVLDNVIDEDFATDQDYDLLYLDLLNVGQNFKGPSAGKV